MNQIHFNWQSSYNILKASKSNHTNIHIAPQINERKHPQTYPNLTRNLCFAMQKTSNRISPWRGTKQKTVPVNAKLSAVTISQSRLKETPCKIEFPTGTCGRCEKKWEKTPRNFFAQQSGYGRVRKFDTNILIDGRGGPAVSARPRSPTFNCTNMAGRRAKMKNAAVIQPVVFHRGSV